LYLLLALKFVSHYWTIAGILSKKLQAWMPLRRLKRALNRDRPMAGHWLPRALSTTKSLSRRIGRLAVGWVAKDVHFAVGYDRSILVKDPKRR